MPTNLLYFGILTLICFQNSTASRHSEEHSSIWGIEVRTTNIGRVKYEDGEVILSQNQGKLTDIFFTPFPRVNPLNSECHQNILSGYVELSLSVDLYTPQLIQTVRNYLKEHFSTLCGENKTCAISLLPMNSIRLVQKGPRKNQTQQLYMIDNQWYSNTVLLQSMDFPIYMTNESVCDHLRSSIVKRCYLPNFEIQYSLHSEKTVERQVNITAEQIMSTSTFNEIRSQFPKADIVVLTGEDFKQLMSEITDKITMKLRVQEGFDTSLQDPIALDRLLEKQLHFRKVTSLYLSSESIFSLCECCHKSVM